jgi:PIN domain nuclease of toxin-antitoxin system
VRLLLDTHLLLWIAEDSDRLSAAALELIEDEANDLAFSVASLWEVSIKFAIARASFEVEPRAFRHGLLEIGFQELAISSEHVIATSLLPLIHRDPFDRLLAAQAAVDGLTLLTADAELARYPGPIRRV